MPILPRERDLRLVTVRRGGSLTDDQHRLLADWALRCAAHVLPLFEAQRPEDMRPREAIAAGHAWIRGDVRMSDARLAIRASTVARGLPDPARFAVLAAGQAAAVPHVAAHDLGAAAYAIRAVMAAAPDADVARREERDRQRAQLPEAVRALVLDDQRRRGAICWHVFDD